ncbi:MAG: glycoside hydrolase [Acidobacteria bacterium]|nr:glycoside hydrolase [Acidobacteriota bacterium]
MRKIWRRAAFSAIFVTCAARTPLLSAQENLVSIDATAPVLPPQPVAAKLGSSRNPSGQVIGVNSQYLTLDGKPWIPVMGEFHYSRYPDAEWEEEILKMKAAGVQVVATYVIWNHHEQIEGVWDWNGQRDLRKFVQICGRHGMYVYPRIGPWSHAEVRHGGFPDWVLKNSPVRENNPIYLREVQEFYKQISAQLRGELWKDGGPVIGIQLENEYREARAGSGRGSEHIRKLKEMAVADGLDVPLYTVTGWDGAAVPLESVLPVFGGYPDAPWDGSSKSLYGNEIYEFRFDNRVAGSMGAVGGHGQNSSASYKGTPFLTAEVGDGAEDTYFRRPVLSADDIAAIPTVMLGSGVNLLGYYMFHGGRNPDSEAAAPPTTLEETQRAGDATDVPEKSYDFQAPIGEFGQERESLLKLKLVHYFLEDFGAELAPMAVRRPTKVPDSPKDTSLARVSARTDGEQGFIFISNYVRGLAMPDRKGFQVSLTLPDGVVKVPEEPIDLPAGDYGIWPVNLPLRGADGAVKATLRSSTAQLFKNVVAGNRTYYFFYELPNIAATFVFGKGAAVEGLSGAVQTIETPRVLELRASGEGAVEIRLAGGISLVALSESEAEQIWRGDDAHMLLRTKAEAFSDGERWTLRSDHPVMQFGLFGTVSAKAKENFEREGESGLFENFQVSVPKVVLKVTVDQLAAAKPLHAPGKSEWEMGPSMAWRPKALPMKPSTAALAGAAEWEIHLPRVAEKNISDAWLSIPYQGDEARLSAGGRLIDDTFWNGLPWVVGIRESIPQWREEGTTLQLQILPLPKDYPMYLEEGAALHFDAAGVAEALGKVRLIPQYQLLVNVTPQNQTR